MEIGLGIFLGIIFVVVAYMVVTRKKKPTLPPPKVRETPNDKA